MKQTLIPLALITLVLFGGCIGGENPKITTTTTMETVTTSTTSTVVTTSTQPPTTIRCIPEVCNELCFSNCGCIDDTQRCTPVGGGHMRCRNPNCPDDTDCVCDSAPTTVTETSIPTTIVTTTSIRITTTTIRIITTTIRITTTTIETIDPGLVHAPGEPPSGAYLLKEVSSEGYSAQYQGYRFKIDSFTYHSESDTYMATIEIERPDGTRIQVYTGWNEGTGEFYDAKLGGLMIRLWSVDTKHGIQIAEISIW